MLLRNAAPRMRERVAMKARRSWLTEADTASERLILDRLTEAFPHHAVLSEESRPDTDWQHGYVWVVDPLDGTRNFAAGIPLYCVNLALALDGEVLVGATYDPERDACVLGAPGRGLTLAGEHVQSSSVSDLASAIVTADLGHPDAGGARMLALLGRLWPEVQGCRIVGSAALGLSWAAAGLTDLMLHPTLYPWDIAAALAQVPAGGGVILDGDGATARLDSTSAVAGAPLAARELLERFGSSLRG